MVRGRPFPRGINSSPSGRGVIPVKPFRDKFLQSKITPSDLARRLGWFAGTFKGGNPKPDTSRVKRRLGLIPYTRGNSRYTCQRVDRQTAISLMIALNMDPHEAGF